MSGDGRPHVRIRHTRMLSHHWSRLTLVDFDLERRDGSWRQVSSEVNDHGDGIAVLPFNAARRTAILIRQFRLPVYLNGHKERLWEACAGLIDEGEEPADGARREALEETGYAIANLEHVGTVFSSPGTLTERMHLFLAHYAPDGRTHDGGGVDHEGEDIEVIELALDEVARMAVDGTIVDAKTLLIIERLRARWPELFSTV
jgi:nudix-type nucleoside diphosphatase (YffH/AdpP family)